MYGPIFLREQFVLPKKPRFFLARVVYAGVLFSLICTTWLLLAGIQPVRNLGDVARLGTLIFGLLAPLQLLVLSAAAALAGTSVVAHEKDRRTFILLLMTTMTSPQIVLGKIGAGLLPTLNLLLAGTPVFFLLVLLGGVSVSQVLAMMLLTTACTICCGSLGAVVALWREKTFQALAVTILTIVLWLGFWEVAAAGVIPGLPNWLATIASPVRALLEICKPVSESQYGPWIVVTLPACSFLLCLGVFLATVGIRMLRIWNPSRQARPTTQEEDASSNNLEKVRSWKVRSARRVWKNPILWREMCTWAYGRKVLVVRIAYLVLFGMAAAALYQSIQTGAALERSSLNDELIPSAARPLTPFFVVSFIILNALAVNSITNERDGQALDLLLVTEVTPPQFMLGKILGVLYVAKEMVLLPIGLCVGLWYFGGLTTENLVYCIGGLLTLDLFVVMLGLHCGMIYSKSRSGIVISLATVFFLFVGVITCMLIMISFRGSFSRQLAPFLTIILGGGTGLYIALGSRNPSPAIMLAAFGLPFLTFFAITSFILRDQELTVFSVITVAYLFATAAMLVPALSEFDFAMGRSRITDDDS